MSKAGRVPGRAVLIEGLLDMERCNCGGAVVDLVGCGGSSKSLNVLLGGLQGAMGSL